MTEQLMATYQITPKFNFESGKLDFLNQKNRPVSFSFLPVQLDVRGGIEKRDYTYLQADVLSPNSVAAIELLMPFMVFPKGFLGNAVPSLKGWQGDAFYADSYTLIQGNTRYKLINDVASHIESIWQIINSENISQDEKIAKFNSGYDRYSALINGSDSEKTNTERYIQSLYECIREVKPFQIMVISDEKASDPKFILWAQRAANDAVKAHSIFQNATMALSYYAFLVEENDKLPKAEQRKTKDIISEAMGAFGLQLSRYYHYRTVLSSPDWLQKAVEDGVMTLDVCVDFITAHNRIAKAYETKGKELATKLEHFYDNVKDVALLDRAETAPLRIFTSHVTTVEMKLMNAIVPDEVAAVDQNQGSESGTGENGDGNQGNENKSDGDKKTKLEVDALAAELSTRFATLAERLLDFNFEGQSQDAEGKPVYGYSEKVMDKLYNASTKLAELLATGEGGTYTNIMTLDQEKAEAELKAEQRKQEKANQSVTVTSDQVAETNETIENLLALA